MSDRWRLVIDGSRHPTTAQRAAKVAKKSSRRFFPRNTAATDSKRQRADAVLTTEPCMHARLFAALFSRAIASSAAVC
jgi:hypothetical protein